MSRLIVFWLALVLGPTAALAQMAKDCTGNTDIPWDQQIVGCTEAIESGRYAGNNLARAVNNRGVAYLAKGDRAIADFDQVIRLNPDDAWAFNNRGFTYV